MARAGIEVGIEVGIEIGIGIGIGNEVGIGIGIEEKNVLSLNFAAKPPPQPSA